MPNKLFTISVATKNRTDLLEKNLDSLTKQLLKPNEILIIDTSDNSQKGSINKFSKKLPISYMFKKGLNIPQARNACLKYAKNNLVLFLDDDCIAPKDWTKKMIGLFVKNQNTALISGDFVHLPRDSVYSIIIEGVRKKRTSLAGKNSNQVYINMGNSLINRLKIYKHGIKFNNPMKREEDIDFALQIINKGLRLIYSKEIFVFHYSRPTLISFLKQRFQNAGNVTRLRKVWKDYDFYFFGSKSSSYFSVYFDLGIALVKKGNFIEFIKLTAVTLLSALSYCLGYLYSFKES